MVFGSFSGRVTRSRLRNALANIHIDREEIVDANGDHETMENGNPAGNQQNGQPEKLNCPHCNKTFSKKANVDEHVKIKHEHRRFICPACKIETSTKFAFNRHLLHQHGKDNIGAYENEVFVLGNGVVKTERALVAKIKRLKKENEKLKKTNDKLKQKCQQLIRSSRSSGRIENHVGVSSVFQFCFQHTHALFSSFRFRQKIW